jgi:uncharacterized protein YjbJ (UPF0337 family)
MTSPMWNRIAGNWKQLKGEVQKKWGRLTNDDLDQVEGIYEQLAGKIQERYGVAQQEAYRQIDEWADEMKARIS